MAMKLKNDSKHNFQFDKKQPLKTFKAGEVATFSDEVGEVLLRHKGVIDLNAQIKSYDEAKDYSKDDEAAAKKSAKKTAKQIAADKDLADELAADEAAAKKSA